MRYRVPAKPKNDNEHLELIARILFVMGFKYSTVEERWPEIKKAFKNFKIDTVAKMRVEDIVAAPGMIKNKTKIQRIIQNAQECQEIIKEFGSMQEWVKQITTQHEEDLLFSPSFEDEIQRRFIGIGKTTREWIAYVFKDGKKKPEWKEA